MECLQLFLIFQTFQVAAKERENSWKVYLVLQIITAPAKSNTRLRVAARHIMPEIFWGVYICKTTLSAYARTIGYFETALTHGPHTGVKKKKKVVTHPY